MRVVEVIELGGPDAVRVGSRPEPPSGDDEVVVAVQAVGLSYPDLLRSRGRYQESVRPPYVLGQEFSGVVASAPPASGFVSGDRVAGLSAGVGAAAELVAVAPAALIPLAGRLSFAEGAGLIYNYETAIAALLIRGRLQAGETVMVHGAAGGTGTAAIQVAKAVGARVIAVVSSPAKAETARAAGADEVVLLGVDWREDVLAVAGEGVDVVFDPVGGERMLDTIRTLRFGGRWVIVGFTAGQVQQIPANRVLLRNVDVVGSYLGGLRKQQPGRVADLRERLAALAATGRLVPVVGVSFPMERAGEALRELDERRARGKVVVRIA